MCCLQRFVNAISIFHQNINSMMALYRFVKMEKPDAYHRAIKRVTKPVLNFKSFHSARNVLAGIELIRKGQMTDENEMSFAEQFYTLAG
jgi:hypothetical protein